MALLVTSSAHAGTSAPAAPPSSGAPAAALPADYGLVLALRGADADLADAALKGAPEGFEAARTGRASWVPTDDPRVTTPLRRALLLNRLEREGVESSSPCSVDVPDFRLIVERLEAALQFLDFKVARAQVELADRAFTCDHSVVSRELIARFFFMYGMLEYYQTRDDRGFFRSAAALGVDNLPVEKVPVAMRAAYEKEAIALARAPRVVAGVPEDLAGLQLWVDGRMVEPGQEGLVSGLHFVQLVSPPQDNAGLQAARLRVSSQEVVGGTPFEVADAVAGTSGSSSSRRIELPPATLKPPTVADLQTQLREAVRVGRLDEALQNAMLALIRGGRHPWAVVVTPEVGIEPAYALWLARDGNSRRVALSTGVSRAGRVASIGLGTTAFLATGTFVYVVASTFLNDTCPGLATFCARDAAQANLRLGVGSGLTVVTGLATAVVVSRTWKVPKTWYRHQRFLDISPSPATTGAVTTHVGPGSVAVELRW